MDILITVPVNPTEDPEKVRHAVLSLFPDAAGAGEETDTLRMAANDIGTLFTRISEQRIRDTARTVLLRSVRGNRIVFHLNKQAAVSGRVNFTDGNSVLGDIMVNVETGEPERFIRTMLGGAG